MSHAEGMRQAFRRHPATNRSPHHDNILFGEPLNNLAISSFRLAYAGVRNDERLEKTRGSHACCVRRLEGPPSNAAGEAARPAPRSNLFSIRLHYFYNSLQKWCGGNLFWDFAGFGATNMRPENTRSGRRG